MKFEFSLLEGSITLKFLNQEAIKISEDDMNSQRSHSNHQQSNTKRQRNFTEPQHREAKRQRTDNEKEDVIYTTINHSFARNNEEGFILLENELRNIDELPASLLHHLIFRMTLHAKKYSQSFRSKALNNILSLTLENVTNLLLNSSHVDIQTLLKPLTPIVSLIYNISYLATIGFDFPAIPAALFHLLIDYQLNYPTTKGAPGQILNALGKMSKHKKIQGFIDSKYIQTMLVEIYSANKSNPNYQSLSVYNASLLALNDSLQGTIDADIINKIIENLENCLDVSHALYGASSLAKKGNLNGMISFESINPALGHFNANKNHNKTHQDKSLITFSLGTLAETGKLYGRLDLDVFHNFIHGLYASSQFRLNSKQTFRGLANIVQYYDATLIKCIPVKLILQLAGNLLQKGNYLHPVEAIYLIDGLCTFSDYHQELNDSFNHTIETIAVPLDYFSPEMQLRINNHLPLLKQKNIAWHDILMSYFHPKKVIEDKTASYMDVEELLFTIVDMPRAPVQTSTPFIQKKLTRPMPHTLTPAPVSNTAPKPINWTNARKNQIFKKIEDKDLKGLSRLLNAKESNPTSLASRSSVLQTEADKIFKQKKTHLPESFLNESNVIQFFKKTDTHALTALIQKSSHQYFDLLLNACSLHQRYQLVINHHLHLVILHLPLKELTAFMEKLISPGQIYRDHHAVISLVDALSIRSKMQPSHAKAIHAISFDLVKNALEFHDKCNHVHVIKHLQPLINLKVNDIDDTRETTKTSVAAPLPAAPASVPAAPLKEVNAQYQYEDNDIEAILRARIDQAMRNGVLIRSINILACVQLHRLVPGNKVEDVLDNFINTNNNNCNGTTLLPIQVNNSHWVGLIIEIRDRKICNMHYFNSSYNEEEDNKRCNIFFNAILAAGLIHNNANLNSINIMKNCLQQTDKTSCGPMLIENFYCTLKGAKWEASNDLMDKIRQRHLDALREMRPDYFPAFEKKQRANINTVPSLTTQLRSHQIQSRLSVAPPAISFFHPGSSHVSGQNVTAIQQPAVKRNGSRR